MAENTKNLGLKKPAPEEFYNIADFNENFQKIDDYMENFSEVDNTADVDKPVSVAQAEAISKAKEEAVGDAQADLLVHTVNTNNPHGVTKAQLGLGYVKFSNSNGVAIGKDAFAPYGGAVGQSAKETAGGGAVGHDATATDGGAVGLSATETAGGGAVGQNAKATKGGAVGICAVETAGGGAVGYNASTSSGAAIGLSARTIGAGGNPIDAIQLGSGINRVERTLQVYGYQLMDAGGYIPSARIPSTALGLPYFILLWENVSPTSVFAAQTIELPTINDYDFLCIEVSPSYANLNISAGGKPSTFQVFISAKTTQQVDKSCISTFIQNGSSVGNSYSYSQYFRMASVINTSSMGDSYTGTEQHVIEFGDCFTANHALSISMLIPYKIYGVKI